MKLRNSITKGEIRRTLISSVSSIFGKHSIVRFLEQICGPLSSAYVLAHTPDQAEDFFVVLVNGTAIVKFELSRSAHAEPEKFLAISVDEYRKALKGRRSLLKLLLAMELAAGR